MIKRLLLHICVNCALSLVRICVNRIQLCIDWLSDLCVFFYCLFTVILKVVATLLKSSTASADLMEVRRLFLSDMIKLFSNSRENRR